MEEEKKIFFFIIKDEWNPLLQCDKSSEQAFLFFFCLDDDIFIVISVIYIPSTLLKE